jgi:type I restriction enzyme S subunit
MIDGLKPYSEYKVSGSRWLGKVPSRWEAVPLGRLLVQRIEQNRPIKTKDILSLSLRQGVIPYSEKKSGGNKAKDDLSAYTLAYPGDIVLNSMNVVVGSVGLSKYFGAVSPVYYVLHTRSKCDSIHYFDAVFQDKTFQQSLWGLGNGIMFVQSKITGRFNTIRLRIPMGALRRVVIPHPEPDEQAAIVRFLEHANRKIDRFIHAKRKLIGLLNEQKQVIVHRTVTRGLDLHTPFKSSGVPWLGDIPKHWELRKLKFVMASRGGGTPSKAVASYWNGDIPWVSPKDMKTDVIDDAEDHITPRAVRESSTNLVASGSILMVVRSGILQRKIPIAICSREVALNQDMKALTPRGSLSQEYFVLLVRGCEKFLLAEWTKQGATVESIEHQFFANTKVPIPPQDEQAEIIRRVASETRPINTAIARTEREIGLMQEYRTRLTADVVTGKLDVRVAAGHLPCLPADSTPDPTAAEPLEETDPQEIQ